MTGGRIVEGYSLTEAMMALCVNPVAGPNKVGSVGLPLPDGGIVGAGLRAKLVQNILSGFLRRFLTVGETDFLESTHLMGLAAFVVRCEPRDRSNYPLACAMSREN